MFTLGINTTNIQALVKKLLKKKVVPRYHDTCQCVQELMNTVIELHSGRGDTRKPLCGSKITYSTPATPDIRGTTAKIETRILS